jgi:hypothetical protein
MSTFALYGTSVVNFSTRSLTASADYNFGQSLIERYNFVIGLITLLAELKSGRS